MVTHFMGDGNKAAAGSGGGSAAGGADSGSGNSSGGRPTNGYALVAQSLARAGVTLMYGVIGIPVTELASAAQAAGIRFISFRNEQAAGYAAAAAGFLTGRPAALLTVSGPGVLHGLPGAAHATVNTWPLLLIAGSAGQEERGKGAFQELDQVEAARQFCKLSRQARSAADVPNLIADAVKATVEGRPGAAYVDIPSDILFAELPQSPALPPPAEPRTRQKAHTSDVQAALDLLSTAQRPLVVVGKGAAFSQADAQLRAFVEAAGAPFLATAMGRGVVPDSHPLSANAARSAALRGADVAIIFGARLNWQLHFGEAPKWAAGVKFILVDPGASPRDAGKAAVVLAGDAGAVAQQLADAAPRVLSPSRFSAWRATVASQAAKGRAKLEARVARESFPLDYSTTLRAVRDALLAVSPAPVVCCEGANTMDNARIILEPVTEGRLRIDAGTWGTMGVGLGAAIAAATARPDRLAVAVEGDSAFGFSGMEVETICRYKLPVVIIVLNNNGIYGGDRRTAQLREAAATGARSGGFSRDPVPTAFVENAKYELLMEAFGGEGFAVNSAPQLAAACRLAFAARRPALINVALDPMAGVESGRAHDFNAAGAQAKL